MFDDIRPYRDAEIPAAMQRITADPLFPTVSRYLFPDRAVEEVAAQLRACRTVMEFQIAFSYPAVYSVVHKTMDALTVEGLDRLDPSESYLFVSNHRDIVLDAAVLQVLLLDAGLSTTEITFGANLMQGQLVVDFGKSNKMFRVERPSTVSSAREFLQKSQELSAYLHDTISHRHESSWIAQRNGRTKDGHDATDPGIVKMFSMAGDIERLHIVPMAVSYEWEPCDLLKVAEMEVRGSGQPYVKKPGEDLGSILTGITQPKGRVHFAACAPLTEDDFAPLRGLGRNAFNREVAALIDRRILAAYRIWPSNRIAAAMLQGKEPERETAADLKAFREHLEMVPEKLRPRYLELYAAPVTA